MKMKYKCLICGKVVSQKEIILCNSEMGVGGIRSLIVICDKCIDNHKVTDYEGR